VARPPRPISRRGEGIEFDRVANFTDAVFAIALTLLVLSIDVPSVKDAELGAALADLGPQIQSFLIGFAVISLYWFGHHGFFRRLDAVDSALICSNLAFLAAIVFIPFATALTGQYGGQPIAFVVYAATLGTASLVDALMYVLAYRHRLFRVQPSPAAYHWSLLASLAPVAVFALSVPIAYVDTDLGYASWLLILVAERTLDHWMPEEYREPGTPE